MTFHADERPIDTSLVRRLIRAQVPTWVELPIEPLAATGTDNVMFRLGSEMVVRLPRIAAAAARIAVEQAWLPRLAGRLPAPIPTLLAAGQPDEDFPWPWSVTHWLDGDNPHADRLADPEGLARDLAAFVAALRRVDASGAPAASRGGPLAARDGPTRAAIAALGGTIDTTAAAAVWDAALRLPAGVDHPVWLHGDLSPGNLLVAGDGRLGGVLDFGEAGIGDPTVDLIAAWNLLPAGARDVFHAALGVDEPTRLRGRGWALSIALIQLPYYRETHPGMAANARHVIHAVLTDHRR